MKPATAGVTLTFHWSDIILPLVILLLSMVLTVYFYARLPAEVAYHFKSDGSADRWLSRGTLILWLLGPQLVFTLLAGAVVWGVTRLSARFRLPESPGIKPARILSFMGNMIVLPQIVLGFAMLDIFSYNSYQLHLMPLWAFALIVMGLGGIILGIFFIQTVGRVWLGKNKL